MIAVASSERNKSALYFAPPLFETVWTSHPRAWRGATHGRPTKPVAPVSSTRRTVFCIFASTLHCPHLGLRRHERRICLDVHSRFRCRIRRVLRPGAIPIDRPGNRGLDIETRRPAETRTRFRAVELQDLRFVRLRRRIQLIGRAITPQCNHAIHNRTDRAYVSIIGAEVPCFREGQATFATKVLGQEHIAVQRVEDELPRTRRPRIAYLWLAARRKSSDEVRKESVARPVATANHIARSCARDARRMRPTKIRGAVGCRHDLRTRFTA